MIPQNQARIFPAKDRSITEQSQLKSWNTFNTISNKESISPFLKFKDNVLAPGSSLKIETDDSADILLLPVAGTLVLISNIHCGVAIEVGVTMFLSLKQNESIEIFNTHEDEHINFLELWIKPGSVDKSIMYLRYSFELDANKNNLIRLFNNSDECNQSAGFYIGRFDGRQEALLHLSKEKSALFVFVIEGAFEVQYRLLETRDALILWDLKEADIEALSNNAVIFCAKIGTPAKSI